MFPTTRRQGQCLLLRGLQGCRSMFSAAPQSCSDADGGPRSRPREVKSEAKLSNENSFTKAAEDLYNTGRALAADVDFYHQQQIALLAEKRATRLTPRQLMYATKPGEMKYLLRSAAFLHVELPVRVAHMVRRFQQLPTLVGQNPHINSVHQLYLFAFKVLTAIKPIETAEQEQDYSKLLRTLLDNHEDVVTTLARGFRECRSIMRPEEVKEFLDSVVTSRLGIRMLAEHHIALHRDTQGHIGVVSMKLSPSRTIRECARFASSQCERRFFRSPEVEVMGHTSVCFPYFAMPLRYILEELLKNAMRATAEHHEQALTLPSIQATICSNEDDFTIRISDLGGGISSEHVSRIHEYMYTTSNEVTQGNDVEKEGDDDSNLIFSFNEFLSSAQSGAGPMSGFGFGFPTSVAFAKYLGGYVSIQSMHGRGTDVYLHLKHFNSSKHPIFE